MIIRSGRPRAGINFKTNGGGVRNYITIAGQSNAGQGTTDVPSELPDQHKHTYFNILGSQQNATRSLKVVPMNYLDNTTYQDPDSTAQVAIQYEVPVLVQTELGGDLYSILYSRGDTNLSTDWAPTGTLYLNWVDKVMQFKNGCYNSDGVYPSLKFAIFDQGEKDGRVLADANNYESRLTTMITNFRAAVGETVPFLLGLFNSDIAGATPNPVPYWATINTAKTNVAAAMTAVHAITMEDAEMGPDFVHYTTDGYITRATNYVNTAIANGYI